MIIITGSSGFIAGSFFKKIEALTNLKIILCDFKNNKKTKNTIFIETDNLFSFIDENKNNIDFIFHLGAITDTTFNDKDKLDKYNLNYSIKVWRKCVSFSIPLIYASSAATYGDGGLGFSDDHKKINFYKPLNLYAESKHEFDKFVLSEKETPPIWFGLKFFNVFGFDESKKGPMSSIVFQSFNQVMKTNKMKLFKSNDINIPHGDQCRDFVYIDDVTSIIYYLYINKVKSGIYNVGSGQVTSFNNLINYVFKSLEKKEIVEYIEMPPKLKKQYQNYTRADISKLRGTGYMKKFTKVEHAVSDYILNYLV